jgi:hypothetical protein
MKFALTLGFAGLLLAAASALEAADEKLPTFTDPKEAGAEYGLQGEYTGTLDTDAGKVNYGVQVIALGAGKFRAVVYAGGLPGEGWVKGQEKKQVEGELNKDGAVVFKGEGGSGTLKDGVITVVDSGGRTLGKLSRVERASPTLGETPPEGAVVIFDGTDTTAFANGKLTDDGLLIAGAITKESFGSFRLHLEFRTPFMPTASGQARGNSGVYLQNAYEIQVLDSFGLEGESNECGGIYGVEAPRLNMCLPPLTWQTYDVEFTAAKFDDQGKKVANAKVTLKFNGQTVYENFELPRLTPGGGDKEAPTGPLMLQDHGNPVHYRNIWIVPLKGEG